MFKLVVSSVMIGFACICNADPADWSINIGSLHTGHRYYVIGDESVYEVQFGLLSRMYHHSDYSRMSILNGSLDDKGSAQFTINEKKYIFVLIEVGLDQYTWTQFMWSEVGRQLTVSDFNVTNLPGEFSNNRGSEDGYVDDLSYSDTLDIIGFSKGSVSDTITFGESIKGFDVSKLEVLVTSDLSSDNWISEPPVSITYDKYTQVGTIKTVSSVKPKFYKLKYNE